MVHWEQVLENAQVIANDTVSKYRYYDADLDNNDNNCHDSHQQQEQQQATSSITRTSRNIFLSTDERYEIWCIKCAERPHWVDVFVSDDSSSIKDDVNHHPEQQYHHFDGVETLGNHSKHHKAEKKDDSNDDDDDHGHDDSTADPTCSTTAFTSATETNMMLPLTDGCDLPAWRQAGIVISNTKSNNKIHNRNSPLPPPPSSSLSSSSSACRDWILSALLVGEGCALMRRESQLPVAVPTRLLQQTWYQLRQRLFHCPRNNIIPRISYHDDPAVSSLHPWFERHNVPVLLTNCATNWPAMQNCTLAALQRRFGDCATWRFSDTHSETMSLNTYIKYIHSMQGQTDDAPLGIYDSQFDARGDDPRSAIVSDYHVPRCFDTDLFATCLGSDSGGLNDEKEEEDRPPYRWILIGPARSGTGLHVDPVGTHAWVTLIEGCKRWVLFPPACSSCDNNNEKECLATSIHMQEPAIPSVVWFRDYYASVLSRHKDAVEVIQWPGETIFVPAGWPHVVLNLGDVNVAITHNYATQYPSMQQLWLAVQAETSSNMAKRFQEGLCQHRPDLFLQLQYEMDEVKL